MKWFSGIIGMCAFAAVAGANEAGMDEVRSLGKLNGQALACSQLDNISRIKKIMISHAPKSRQYGDAFEQSTQKAFLQRSSEQQACVDVAVIALKVESVAARLQAMFPPTEQPQ
jgi:tetrahydromethanopterin S-methyltransferase subunit E